MTHAFAAAPARRTAHPRASRAEHSKTPIASTFTEKVQISCASQLYLAGMNLFAIQELLGHSWTATTARYIHVHATHVEDAWVSGQRRVADRWKGLAR
jgi:site-specific recombinase XerD